MGLSRNSICFEIMWHAFCTDMDLSTYMISDDNHVPKLIEGFSSNRVNTENQNRKFYNFICK